MKLDRYEYSSTQINLPPNLTSRIIRWGKDSIPEDQVYKVFNEPGYGREGEIHVTVLYGLHETSPDRLRDILNTQDLFHVRLGKVTSFTNPDKFDVVKVDVESPELHQLNTLLRTKFHYTSNFPVYRPHVTIAYVKKGLKVSSDVFEGMEFTVGKLKFSSRSGAKYELPLKGKPAS